jgi:hypothetical protein
VPSLILGCMDSKIPPSLRRVIADQAEVVSRQQLLMAGVSRTAIDSKIQRGIWRQLHLGVYGAFTGAVPWEAHGRPKPPVTERPTPPDTRAERKPAPPTGGEKCSGIGGDPPERFGERLTLDDCSAGSPSAPLPSDHKSADPQHGSNADRYRPRRTRRAKSAEQRKSVHRPAVGRGVRRHRLDDPLEVVDGCELDRDLALGAAHLYLDSGLE